MLTLKDKILLSGANFISSLGDNIAYLVVVLYFSSQTQMLNASTYLSLYTLSIICGSLLTGKYAAKANKVKLLVINEFVCGLVVLALAFLTILGSELMFAMLLFVLGFISGVSSILMSASIPNAFAREEVKSVNYYITFTTRLASVFGSILAGYLAIGQHYFVAFIIDAVTFFIAAFIFFKIFAPTNTTLVAKLSSEQATSYYHSLKFLLSRKDILLKILIVFVVNASLAPISSLFPFEAKAIGWNEEIIGYVFSAFGAGAFLAPVLGAKRGVDKTHSFLVRTLIFLVCYTIFIDLYNISISLLSVMLLGLLSVQLLVSAKTTLQIETPSELVTQTLASFNLLFMIAKPASMMMGGLWITKFPASSYFTAMAVAILIFIALYSGFTLKQNKIFKKIFRALFIQS